MGKPHTEDQNKMQETTDIDNTEQHNMTYQQNAEHNTLPWGELKKVIKTIKRRGAPGPDNMPTEIIKELGECNIEPLPELSEIWWQEKDMNEEDSKPE